MENFNLKKYLTESKLLKENLQDDLLTANDGPLDTFGVISRAIEMASNGIKSPEIISNALYEALIEIGALTNIEIPSNEFR